MSLLLAILQAIAPPDTTNKFGGGMFVKAMYDRRKRKEAPPRLIEYPEDRTAFGRIDPTKPKNLVPVTQPKPKAPAKATRMKSRPVISLAGLANGSAAQQNVQRMIKAELEIQARRNQNDAMAVLLLLAS